MTCPFLHEARVKTCRRSPFRKMIVRTPGDGDGEKCSSPEYFGCPTYHGGPEGAPRPQCPELEEKLVQYCSAASVTKFIPYSDSLLSRCGGDGHRYCEIYFELANSALPPRRPELPSHLYYSTNHLWLDVSEQGLCHVGIDAFLAKILGSVEQISFLTLQGVYPPAAVLSARGVDIELAFPHSMRITASNLYLRANPWKLTTEPYSRGWLFEGRESQPGGMRAELLYGREAREWMRHETDRLSAYRAAYQCGSIDELTREERLQLFHAFASLHANRREP